VILWATTTNGERMADGTTEAPSAARRQAVVDAMELARLHVEVLTELRDAEARGEP
jgi:hypothetical protein